MDGAPLDAGLVAAWDDTDLLITRPDGEQVVWLADDPAPAALLEHLPFAVVTAHNPGGRPAPPAINRARDARLRAAARGSLLRVVGRSADGLHEEAGYALLGRDRDTALALAREFGQLAIFWCEPGGFRWVRT